MSFAMTMVRVRTASAALAAALLVGCGDGGGGAVPPKDPAGKTRTVSPAAGPWFTEITEPLGLAQPASTWPDGRLLTPEISPGGVLIFDYDGDGKLDIYQVCHAPPADWPRVIQTPAPNRLFRNLGNGKFAEVEGAAGLADPGYGHGGAIGDINNDGHDDVFVTNYGRDALYLNNGDATFTNITDKAGITGEHWSSASAFFDYDRDGFLDLWVVHFAKFDPARKCGRPGDPDYCGPHTFPGVRDTLYRNNGDSTFTDVSEKAGIKVPARGWGVVTVDFNNDGFIDVLVANDEEPNQLWINKGDGTFVDEAVVRGVAVNGAGRVEANMGVAVGDMDDDGVFDLFITHITGEKNTLWLSGQGGPGKPGGPGGAGGGPMKPGESFSDKSAASGMAAVDLPYTGWGCGLVDFNHDGLLDVAVVNGRVAKGSPNPRAKLGPFWAHYAEENLLFRNDGAARFTSLPAATGGDFLRHAEITRALAFADLDDDGDLDLITSTVGNTLRVYRNDAPAGGSHWLMVRARTGKRDALGARIKVVAAGRQRIANVITSYSYLASNDPRAHFGMGAADRYDAIEVTWPDGKREQFEGGPADRVVTLQQGQGKSIDDPPGKARR